MNFIKLTGMNGNPVYINMNNITVISRRADGVAEIWIPSGNYICVRETPEEVMDFILNKFRFVCEIKESEEHN